MTSTPPPRGINLRGAVDLSGLTRRPPAGRPAPTTAPTAGAAAPPAGGPPAVDGAQVPSLVIDVTTENFESVLALSGTVPVVLDLWATWCEPCKQLSPILERLVEADGGRWLLAKIDVDAEQQIAGMLRVQSLPTVLAVVGGRPVPLFQGALPQAQVRQVIDELLTVAAQNGVTGRLTVDAAAAPPAQPELPPLHQEAFEALERDDLPAAETAYRSALRENPGDAMARVGLAQVHLLQRISTADVARVQATLAGDPDDVEASLTMADVEVASGRAAEAFARLVALVRVTSGDVRDRVRLRLVELFDIIGADSEDVIKARRALASALF